MADGIICLSVDFTAAPGTQTTAVLQRGTSATGPWSFIREVNLLDQQAHECDATAPLDTPVWYRWIGDPGGQIIVQGPFTETSTGTVLIKDPLRPWANVEASFCSTPHQALSALCSPEGPDIVWVGLDEKTYRADANLFDVYNARVPADLYGVRKRLDSGMRLFTKTCEAKDAVETLFAAGGPLQLQLPAEYCFPDAIVQPGDLVEDYLPGTRDQRRPYRLWSAPFTVVDRPFGPIQGTECANWCTVAEVWPTFADMTASGATWAEIADGTAQCFNEEPLTPLLDTFTRVVVDGWGNADTGQTWTNVGGAAANYDVNGTRGTHTHSVIGLSMNSLIPWPTADVTVKGDWSVDSVPTGNAYLIHLLARMVDVNNGYVARLRIDPAAGAMVLTIRKRVAGVETQLSTVALGINYVANTVYTMRFRVDGTNLMAKMWLTSGTEPAGWQTTAVDADFAAAANVGYKTSPFAGVTVPPPITFTLDNFSATL